MWEERNCKHLNEPGNQLLLDCWFTANRIVSSPGLDNANNRKYQNMLPRLHSNMKSEKRMYFFICTILGLVTRQLLFVFFNNFQSTKTVLCRKICKFIVYYYQTCSILKYWIVHRFLLQSSSEYLNEEAQIIRFIQFGNFLICIVLAFKLAIISTSVYWV